MRGTDQPTIGLVVLARNEAASIGRCLDSVAGEVEEMVVLDMQSEDATAAIAAERGAVVESVPIRREFDGLRQRGVDLLRTDWVLQLDADEWATGVLPRVRAAGFLDQAKPLAFPKVNYLGDRWLRRNHWWPNYQVRMFRRGHGRFRDVFHDYLETDGEAVRLPPDPDFAIHHAGHSDGADLLHAVSRFVPPPTDLTLREAMKILARPIGSYVVSRGWRDGSDGIVVLAGKVINSLGKATSAAAHEDE